MFSLFNFFRENLFGWQPKLTFPVLYITSGSSLFSSPSFSFLSFLVIHLRFFFFLPRFFASSILHHTSSSSLVHTPVKCVNYVVSKPVGVACLISPWNLPLYLLTWKIAPCIAMGFLPFSLFFFSFFSLSFISPFLKHFFCRKYMCV